jgi:hypothetical protein
VLTAGAALGRQETFLNYMHAAQVLFPGAAERSEERMAATFRCCLTRQQRPLRK